VPSGSVGAVTGGGVVIVPGVGAVPGSDVGVVPGGSLGVVPGGGVCGERLRDVEASARGGGVPAGVSSCSGAPDSALRYCRNLARHRRRRFLLL
jgi:hypothetical protein